MADLNFLPAKVRGIVYGVAALAAIVAEAATKGYENIDKALPVWLEFLNGALPTILAAVGVVALSHVVSKATPEALVEDPFEYDEYVWFDGEPEDEGNPEDLEQPVDEKPAPHPPHTPGQPTWGYQPVQPVQTPVVAEPDLEGFEFEDELGDDEPEELPRP